MTTGACRKGHHSTGHSIPASAVQGTSSAKCGLGRWAPCCISAHISANISPKLISTLERLQTSKPAVEKKKSPPLIIINQRLSSPASLRRFQYD